jgi:Zn ribbon nucleic-acid-binding protein
VNSLHDDGGPATFLEDLRCLWCHALNTSRLWADGSTVECTECGQTSLTIPARASTPGRGAGLDLGADADVAGEGV